MIDVYNLQFDLDKGYFPPERAYNYNIPEVYFNIISTSSTQGSLSGQKISFNKKKNSLTSCINFFIKKFFFFENLKKKKLTPLEPQGGDKEEFGMKQDIFF